MMKFNIRIIISISVCNSNPTRAFSFMHLHEYVDGLAKDRSNSIANTLE